MLYSNMKELESAGFSQRVIAKQLNVSRNTVKKYLSQDIETFIAYVGVWEPLRRSELNQSNRRKVSHSVTISFLEKEIVFLISIQLSFCITKDVQDYLYNFIGGGSYAQLFRNCPTP